MARKPSTPQPPPRTELLVSREAARKQLNERIAKGRELRARLTGPYPYDDGVQAIPELAKWTSYNAQMLRSLFSTQEIAQSYDYCTTPFVTYGEPTPPQRLHHAKQNIDAELQNLESVSEQLGLYPEPPPSSAPATLRAQDPLAAAATASKAFVVHGHDQGALQAVARFLERLGIEPVILHEQASRGDTLIEKLERYNDVSFAVVLLTPDDEGRLAESSEQLRPRARQNVILELGYFVARLTRERVCALHSGEIELPSDWDGVAWVALDERGAWKLELARELKAAGFDINMNLAV